MRKLLLLLLLLPLADTGCRKDYRDNFLPVKPKHFLSGDKYEKLVVEVVYVEGYAPDAQTITHLQNFLAARLNKPKGIFITQRSIPSPGYSTITRKDLEQIEKSERTQFTKGKRLAAFVFFANAPYSEDAGNNHILGVAYGTTAIGIFEKTVKDFSGGISQPTTFVLEATTLEHEFGHLFGLVDNGTPMQSSHKDEANGPHCTDTHCLMYYQVETTDFLANLMPGQVPEFDAQCLADLRANGGK